MPRSFRWAEYAERRGWKQLVARLVAVTPVTIVSPVEIEAF